MSAGKFCVFFSFNIPQETREELCNILEFQSTPSLGKYLGFLIKHSLSAQHFEAVIECQNQLAGWKTHLLSFAGKLVLTQATISAILNYSMQCVVLPSKVIQCVDRLCKNFLWGSIDNKKKIHLISWKKITKPKQDGGHGLQSAKEKKHCLTSRA